MVDLAAYCNIGSLDALAKANGIDMPSIRGYRLMRDEEPWDKEYIADTGRRLVGEIWWMESDRDPCWRDHNLCEYVDGYRPSTIPPSRVAKAYREELGPTITVFDRVSMTRARWHRQAMLWNRYAGKEGVLYIHSRIGGDGRAQCDYYAPDDDARTEPRWKEGWDVRDQPWFLDVCADAFDPTYCDVYARLQEGEE